MHAASVHPEPGSNSLKNCIITSKLVIIIISRLSGFVRRFIYTGFSTSSGLLSINFKRISGSFVCFKLSLFNLQGTMLFAIRFCEVARLFYHILIGLSRTFFISFFKLSCDRRVLLNSDLIILSLSHQLVKRFFQVLNSFQKWFVLISQQRLDYLTTSFAFCQPLFHLFPMCGCQFLLLFCGVSQALN